MKGMGNHLCLWLLCLCLPLVLTQQTLYVDGIHGKDSNNGTSPLFALKTITAAMSNVFPGVTESIQIFPGIYRETVTIDVSGTPTIPLRIEAVTPGTVFVRGSELIRNISLVEGTNRIYVADLPSMTQEAYANLLKKKSILHVAHVSSEKLSQPVFSITEDDVLHLARAPNLRKNNVLYNETRVLYWWKADPNSTYSSTNLWLFDATNDTFPVDMEKGNLKDISFDLTGAVIVMLDAQKHEIIYQHVINYHDRSKGIVYFNNTKGEVYSNGTFSGCIPQFLCTGEMNPYFGLGKETFYYVENKFELLDAPGEYFVDKLARKIYFIPPAQHTVGALEISVRNEVLTSDNDASNIMIKGIHFQLAEGSHYFQFIYNWTVENCEFSFMETPFGFFGNNHSPCGAKRLSIQNLMIKNNVFHHLDFGIIDGFSTVDDSCPTNTHQGITFFNNEVYEIATDPSKYTFGVFYSGLAIPIFISNPFQVSIVNNYFHHLGTLAIALRNDNLYYLSNTTRPYNQSQIVQGTVNIQNNKFEKCGILLASYFIIIIGGDTYRDLLIEGNIFSNSTGYSYPMFLQASTVGANDYSKSLRGVTIGVAIKSNGGVSIVRNLFFDIAIGIALDSQSVQGPMYIANNLFDNCVRHIEMYMDRPHVDTVIINNVFTSSMHTDISIIGPDTQTPLSGLLGNILLDNNVHYHSGYYQSSINSEIFNLTQSVMVLGAYEFYPFIAYKTVARLQGVNNTNSKTFAANPQFANVDPLTQYTTNSYFYFARPNNRQMKWTDFIPLSSSSLINRGIPLPTKLKSVLSIFGDNLASAQVLNIGPFQPFIFEAFYSKGSIPIAPIITNIATGVVTKDSIQLIWPLSSVVPIQLYEVQISNSTFSEQRTVSSTSANYYGLNANSLYQFRIRALTVAGWNTFSSPFEVRTLAEVAQVNKVSTVQETIDIKTTPVVSVVIPVSNTTSATIKLEDVDTKTISNSNNELVITVSKYELNFETFDGIRFVNTPIFVKQSDSKSTSNIGQVVASGISIQANALIKSASICATQAVKQVANSQFTLPAVASLTPSGNFVKNSVNMPVTYSNSKFCVNVAVGQTAQIVFPSLIATESPQVMNNSYRANAGWFLLLLLLAFAF